MPTSPPTIEDVFAAVLECDSSTDRGALLAELCGTESSVRVRVEALLRAHASSGTFLETPLVGWDTDEVDPGRGGDWPQPPAERGDYVDWQPIARGGMGIVFRARDEKLDRLVAVKMLDPVLASTPESRQRFLREARAAAAVRDAHVVTIHAIVDDADPPYLVMEWIAGETLQERLADGKPLPWCDAVRIAGAIATGLAAAHERGIVHRDVKPGNVLLEAESGRVRITDFGLARAVDDLDLTREGIVAGTPRYMSPEQARGRAVDHRTDLFSLGATLYAMLTGRLPAMPDEARSPETVARELPSEAPGRLIDLVARLLRTRPEERPGSASEVAATLAAITEDERLTTPVAGIGRGRWYGGAVAAAFIVAVAVFRPRFDQPDHVIGNDDEVVTDTAAVSPPAPKRVVADHFDPEPADDGTPDPARADGTDTETTAVPETMTTPVDSAPPAIVVPPVIGSPGKLVEIRRMQATGRLGDLAVSARHVFVVGEKGTVHGWDLKSGEPCYDLEHEANVTHVVVTDDGMQVATADLTRHVRLWDTETGRPVGAIPVAVPVRDMTYSPPSPEPTLMQRKLLTSHQKIALLSALPLLRRVLSSRGIDGALRSP